MATALLLARMQNFPETIRQTRRTKNFREKQERAARIFMLCDGQEATAKLRVGGKLFGAGEEPGIDLGIDGAERRLQLWRVALRVVHQKTGVDTEETRKKSARTVREVRPRAALYLGKVSLAKAAAYFTFHGFGEFLLGHGAAKATQGTFHGAKRTEFIAESHRRTHLLQFANTILLFAISCQGLYLPCFH